MEIIDLYEASIEKIIVDKPNNIAKFWRVVGLFVNKQDAIDAVKIYEVVHRGLGENLSHNYDLAHKTFPRNLRHRYYKIYFKNLDEFIKDDKNIMGYLQVNNLTADELLNQINNRDNKAQKELRIIERMLKECEVQLQFARRDGLMEETVQKLEENVEYLQSLRDEKSGFTK